MIKMSVFNKINDNLIVDTFKNDFQRGSSEVFQPDTPECRTIQKYMLHCRYSIICTLYNVMLVGHLQKVNKSVLRESDQFSTCLWLLHRGVKRVYSGWVCQQLHKLHEACCLQHNSIVGQLSKLLTNRKTARWDPLLMTAFIIKGKNDDDSLK